MQAALVDEQNRYPVERYAISYLASGRDLLLTRTPQPIRNAPEMMTAYYNGLKRGEGRGDALRGVQLEMLRNQNTRHPFYWAPFIQSGEWANLARRR